MKVSNNCSNSNISITPNPLSTKLLFSLHEMKCNAIVPTSQSILQLHREKEGQVKCINTTRFRDGKLNWLSMKMKSSIQSPEVSAHLSHCKMGSLIGQFTLQKC